MMDIGTRAQVLLHRINKQASLRQRLTANFGEPGSSLLLVLLLVVDLAFMIVHCLHVLTPFFEARVFSIQRDAGFAEMFQYIKFAWLILLLLYLNRVTRLPGYVAWILVFGYLLMDDALQIHERGGVLIAEYLNVTPPFNLRPVDIGELAVSAVAGTILALAVGWAYWRGSSTFRKITKDLLIFIIAMAFFGIGADMAQIAIQLGREVDLLLTLIEDGGEMVVASLIVWYVFLLAIRKGQTPAYLWDIFAASLKSR
jgi:hypothetical protein